VLVVGGQLPLASGGKPLGHVVVCCELSIFGEAGLCSLVMLRTGGVLVVLLLVLPGFAILPVVGLLNVLVGDGALFSNPADGGSVLGGCGLPVDGIAWEGQSLVGIQLYLPSGSPGSQGIQVVRENTLQCPVGEETPFILRAAFMLLVTLPGFEVLPPVVVMGALNWLAPGTLLSNPADGESVVPGGCGLAGRI
jgi:hypothetical protein